MPTIVGDKLVHLEVPISADAALRLEGVAERHGISAVDFARNAIETAIASASEVVDTVPVPEVGYRWKNVFLPDGTVLSFSHRGTSHLAVVTGSELLHEGKAVSPSEFVNSISGAIRNAWRDVWVKRPSDVGWLAAQELRNDATTADFAKRRALSDAAATATVNSAVDTNGRPVVAGLLPGRRFGGSPISERMGPRYLAACRTVMRIMETKQVLDADPDLISEAKGMFNRVIKHDRHDWMAVQQLLGLPDRRACVQAAAWLKGLRALVIAGSSIAEHLEQPTAAAVASGLRSASAELEEQGFDGMIIDLRDEAKISRAGE